MASRRHRLTMTEIRDNDQEYPNITDKAKFAHKKDVQSAKEVSETGKKLMVIGPCGGNYFQLISVCFLTASMGCDCRSLWL